jgi:hypothetical protein
VLDDCFSLWGLLKNQIKLLKKEKLEPKNKLKR